MSQGLLLVNKPSGPTSHDVVAQCRRWLQRKDIGHAGTLDPMAEGLLVLLVGQATKLSDYILNGDKAYQVGVQLGVVTDTDDSSGEVLQTHPVQVDNRELLSAVAPLTGELDLAVPRYSAKKVKGQKLYEKARRGEDFEPPRKKMTFHHVEVLTQSEDRLSFQMSCSKGSYVRSWVRQLGEDLGCGATMTHLCRTHSAPYDLQQSMPLDELLELAPEQVERIKAWVPMPQTLPNWPSVKVEGREEKLIANGQIPKRLERFLELEFSGNGSVQGIKILSRRTGGLVALLEHEPPLKFKIKRVFPIKH